MIRFLFTILFVLRSFFKQREKFFRLKDEEFFDESKSYRNLWFKNDFDNRIFFDGNLFRNFRFSRSDGNFSMFLRFEFSTRLDRQRFSVEPRLFENQPIELRFSSSTSPTETNKKFHFLRRIDAESNLSFSNNFSGFWTRFFLFEIFNFSKHDQLHHGAPAKSSVFNHQNDFPRRQIPKNYHSDTSVQCQIHSELERRWFLLFPFVRYWILSSEKFNHRFLEATRIPTSFAHFR